MQHNGYGNHRRDDDDGEENGCPFHHRLAVLLHLFLLPPDFLLSGLRPLLGRFGVLFGTFRPIGLELHRIAYRIIMDFFHNFLDGVNKSGFLHAVFTVLLCVGTLRHVTRRPGQFQVQGLLS